MDRWGNLTQMKVYDINSSTVRRTYNSTYLSDANHSAVYIRNRMASTTAQDGTSAAVTLATNVYDDYGPPVNNPIVNVINIRQFDSATSTTSFQWRGNWTKVDQ